MAPSGCRYWELMELHLIGVLAWTGQSTAGPSPGALACKDCHHHSPDLRLVLSAHVRRMQERAQPSTMKLPRAKCAPICAPTS